MRGILPQRCPVPFLYLTWALYLGVPVFLALGGRYASAALWAVGFPVALWVYVMTFPRTGSGTEASRTTRTGRRPRPRCA